MENDFALTGERAKVGETEVNPVKLLFRDREEFRSFHMGQEQSLLVVAILYAVAIGGLALVWATMRMPLTARIPADIVAFVIVGWAQYSLGNGLHEAVHHNLRNRNTDLWASLLTAYPVGLTIAYRQIHLGHHKYLGTENDPEFDLYTAFPQTKIALAVRFVWFISGIPAILQFFQLQRLAASNVEQRSHRDMFLFAGVQIGLLALFWSIFGSPVYYVVFWILPIATVGKLLSSTRLLCEHGSPHRDWVVRTIDGARWQTWVMGAFDFNYHGEHHLIPSVPFAHLQQLHRVHRAYIEQHPLYRPIEGRFEFISGGYLSLLAHWFRILPWRRHSQPHLAS